MPSTKLDKIGAYFWGYHGSDEQYAHIAVVAPGYDPDELSLTAYSEGIVSDIIDVTFYDRTVMDQKTGKNAMEQSRDDLTRLIEDANIGLRVRESLEGFDAPENEDELEDWLDNLDSEPYGRYQALTELLQD